MKTCCAVLRNRRTGKTRFCKKEAVNGSWCEKHGRTMDGIKKWNTQMLKDTNGGTAKDDENN